MSIALIVAVDSQDLYPEKLSPQYWGLEPKGEKMKTKVFIVVFVVLLATLSAVMFTRHEGQQKGSQQALGSSSASSSQEKQVATVLCDGFDIRPDAHVGDKVVSVGIKGDANAVREATLEEAKHNTVMLRLLWNSSPLASGGAIGSEGELVDSQNCLTADARQKWYQLKGAVMSAQVVNEPAPAGGMNTGANGNGAYQAAGVAEENGDGRMATRVTYQNGKSVWVLHRCGNVVVEGTIPQVPDKPRDHEEGKDANLSSRGQGGTDRGVVTGPGYNGGGGTADNTIPQSNSKSGCQGNCPGSQPPQPPPAEKPPQPGTNTGRV